MYTRVLLACPLLGLSSFGMSFIGGFTVYQSLNTHTTSLTFPSSVPLMASYPGSLNMGSGMNIIPCMDSRTWSRLEWAGSHFSVASPPCQVPSRLRHTLPSAYRLGLNLGGGKKFSELAEF